MNKTRQSLVYVFFDFVVSYGAWLLFFYFKFSFIISQEITPKKFNEQLINSIFICAYWVIVYALSGLYKKPYRRSRMKEISQVFKSSLLGVLVIFFLIFLNDPIPNYQFYYNYVSYFLLQFLAISIIRFIITTRTNLRLSKRIIGFPTLIVGSGDEAQKIWEEIKSRKRSLGFDLRGFVSLPNMKDNQFFGKLKHFGQLDRLPEIIRNRKIEEVIIAVEKEDKDQILEVIDQVEGTGANIKIVPGVYDYIFGSVRVTHVLGAPLIEIFPQIIPTWQAFLKRLIDIGVSIAALICLSPMYLLIAILVKTDSKGPIFFKQERIGKGGKPFKIIKYRTMRTDAEKFGPALSSDNDPRITKVGKFLRKSRLDEFPQFWNVLIGDMALVGPRPERQFFIDQIVKHAPHYKHLHKVRPGITSWGQVKYGYAENVEQMVERLKFDILYIENMSLGLDLKIVLYTVLVIFEGRGK